MNELTSIAESLGTLQSLAARSTIFLDDLPIQFRADLQSFIRGETLTMRDQKIVIGKNLYNKWLAKINTRGFDYEIDFKQ